MGGGGTQFWQTTSMLCKDVASTQSHRKSAKQSRTPMFIFHLRQQEHRHVFMSSAPRSTTPG